MKKPRKPRFASISVKGETYVRLKALNVPLSPLVEKLINDHLDRVSP